MIQAKKNWHFHNPVEIIVGRGCREQLVNTFKQANLLVVTTKRGKQQFSEDVFLGQVVQSNSITWVDSVTENPGLTYLEQEIKQLQGLKVDAVIAFGGGSAMDAAKAIRLGIACQQPISLVELLNQPELHSQVNQAPLYTLPTTSGTGSEVTPFATVWHHEIQKKLSLASDSVFPTTAIVDAQLTDSLPTKVTLSTGLDAINQAAESVWNKNANSITLLLATRALKLGLEALPKLIKDSGDIQMRDQMAEASLLSGLAISHTRTALCHSISYPLTAHFDVPHGLACAFTMPEVCRLNLEADDGRFVELAYALTGNRDPQAFYQLFVDLNNELNVSDTVKSYIPSLEALLALQDEMYNPSRAGNNLATLQESSLQTILNKAFNN